MLIAGVLDFALELDKKEKDLAAQTQKDLATMGISFRYEMDGKIVKLDPTKVTIFGYSPLKLCLSCKALQEHLRKGSHGYRDCDLRHILGRLVNADISTGKAIELINEVYQS